MLVLEYMSLKLSWAKNHGAADSSSQGFRVQARARISQPLVTFVRPSAATENALILVFVSPSFSPSPDSISPLELSYPPRPHECPRVVSLRALFWNRKFVIYSHGFICMIPRAHQFCLAPLDPAFVFRSPVVPYEYPFVGNTNY